MPAILSPIDGKPAFSFSQLDAAAALERVAAAEAAQRAWRQTSIAERSALLLRMLDRYAEHAEANAEAITRMMGKPLAQAKGEFAGGFSQRTRHLCAVAEHALRDLEIAQDEHGPLVGRERIEHPCHVASQSRVGRRSVDDRGSRGGNEDTGCRRGEGVGH